MRVFIFIHTDHIGGAEKRFAGLWQAFQGKEDVHLVLQPALHKRLMADAKLERTLMEYSQNVHFLNRSKIDSVKNLYEDFIQKFTRPEDIFHFIGEHPFLRKHSHRQVFSITQSSLKNMNTFGKVGQFLGVFLSSYIDILDPRIYRLMQKVFFYKKNRISLTSNSFCDVSQFSALSFEEKKDWLVFLGRFEAMKQVLELIKALPAIHQVLKHIASKDLHYYFLGHGTLETEMKELLQQDEFRNIPVTIGFNDKPSEVLKQSKVFFSLQRHNNYPSRSLIEAMAAGNIPLATEIGETRWLAKPTFSYYVPENFSAQDLVKQLKDIFSSDQEMIKVKSEMARKTVVEEHTIEKMCAYYLNIYQQYSFRKQAVISL